MTAHLRTQVVPYTRPVRGGGPCGGVVGIENVGDSPMPEPTSVLPECEATKCDGGSPPPEAPIVAFVTPGPTGGLLSFQGQPCTHCEVCTHALMITTVCSMSSSHTHTYKCLYVHMCLCVCLYVMVPSQCSE